MQKLFEYAVIFHPRASKEQKESGEQPKSVLLVPLTDMLASDQKEVGLIAARAIPDTYTDKLEQIEIVIRPF